MAVDVLIRGITLLALLVACSTPPRPPSFTPPSWSRQDVAREVLASLYVRVAISWDGGFLVGGDYPQPAMFFSRDGRQWIEQPPEGFGEYLRGQPFAAHGSTAYILGGEQGRVAMWRTDNETTWERSPLPRGDIQDPFLAIAAGPRGVLVVGNGRSRENPVGFEFWHSADGWQFRYLGGGSIAYLKPELAPKVVASDEGFLLYESDAYTLGPALEDVATHQSADGEHWVYIGDGLPVGRRCAAGRTGTRTFVLGLANSGGLCVRHRRDGGDWQDGTIDLGRFPDARSPSPEQQRPAVVHPWGTGFLAVGNTVHAELAGLAWTSPDGVTWTRMPVQDNGFDELVDLRRSRRAGLRPCCSDCRTARRIRLS